jgi:hypothetical protein
MTFDCSMRLTALPLIRSSALFDCPFQNILQSSPRMAQRVNVDAALILQIVNRLAHGAGYRMAAGQAARRIAEEPAASIWCRLEGILQNLLLLAAQNPRIVLADQRLKIGIECAPDQGVGAALTVEKTLVAESGVIRVRLAEHIAGSAMGAWHNERLGVLTRHGSRCSNFDYTTAGSYIEREFQSNPEVLSST